MDNNNQKKRNNYNSAPGFFRSKRFLFMLLGMILFLPPLSILPQLTGDNNFCGTWCPRTFFLWHQISKYPTSLTNMYMGVILVLGVVIVTFFFGRYWCSHVCPIGGVTEIGSKVIPEGIKLNYSPVPASAVRYGYLSVYLIAPIFAIGHLCCRYCNFLIVPSLLGAPFNSGDMSYFLRTRGIIGLGLIVILGFFAKGGRAYCNMLCPVGALDALSNKIGSRLGFTKRMRIEANKCNGCGDCVKSCPTWAITLEDKLVKINQFSCMPCRECEKICPKEAISYGRIEK